MHMKKIIKNLSIIIAILAAMALVVFINREYLEQRAQTFIIEKFQEYLENSLGSRLHFNVAPQISLFPRRSIELGSSTWSTPDGSVNVSFSRAYASISSHALFTGRLVIKKLEVSGLTVIISHSPYEVKIKEAIRQHDLLNKLSARSQLFRNILDYAPNAVTITGGRGALILDDGRTFRLDSLDFSASNIHADSNTSFSLRASVACTEPQARASLNMDGALAIRKNSVFLALEKSILTPQYGISFSEPITLAGGLEYSLSSGALTLDKLHFSGFSQQISTSGNVESLPKILRDPHSGRMMAHMEATFDPPALSRFFPTYSALLGEVGVGTALSTDFTLGDEKASFRNITCSFGDTTLTGELIQPLRQAALEGRIYISSVTMPSFSRLFRAITVSPLLSEPARWPRVALTLQAGEFVAGSLHASGLSCRLAGKDGEYELNPLSFEFAGSPVIASLKFNLLPTSPLSARGQFSMSAPGTELRRIASFFPPALSMDGNINANIVIDWTSSRSLATLSGKGSITSDNFQFTFPSGTESTETQPGNLFSTFVIKGGILSCDNFSFTADGLDIVGKTMIDLRLKTLDASGEVRRGANKTPFKAQGNVLAPSFILSPEEDERLNIRLPVHSGAM